MSLKYQPVNLAELLKQPHPSIDLRLEQYSRATEAFTKSVRAYVARATSEIHARRDTHVKEVKIAGEKAKETEVAIARMKEQGMALMKGARRVATTMGARRHVLLHVMYLRNEHAIDLGEGECVCVCRFRAALVSQPPPP